MAQKGAQQRSGGAEQCDEPGDRDLDPTRSELPHGKKAENKGRPVGWEKRESAHDTGGRQNDPQAQGFPRRRPVQPPAQFGGREEDGQHDQGAEGVTRAPRDPRGPQGGRG